MKQSAYAQFPSRLPVKILLVSLLTVLLNGSVVYNVQADGETVLTGGAQQGASQNKNIQIHPIKRTNTLLEGCSPNSGQVALFADPNFGGNCVVEEVGDYPDPDSLGMADDTISSVKVGGNTRVVLCANNNYTGMCSTLLADDPDLSDDTVGNDQASSARVEKKFAEGIKFSTYLGGSNLDNQADLVGDMAVDSAGNIYVVGYTTSLDFPTTSGAFDTTFNGEVGTDQDAFIAKFDSEGKTLIFATFLGGTGNDWANGVEVDTLGNIYVTGRTESIDFPITSGSQNQDLKGGSDIFITKLNSSGTGLIYSGLFGGNSWDESEGIALDQNGDIYITGFTYSKDFPEWGTVLSDCSTLSNYMSFASRFRAADLQLVYSTCLGSNAYSTGQDIDVDSDGNAIIVGRYGASFSGGLDLFIMKLNPTGNELIFSTNLDGSGDDEPFAVVVDRAGDIYVTGYTNSNDFPTTPGALYPTRISLSEGWKDAFVTKLSSEGGDLVYSTYLGGKTAWKPGDCNDYGNDIDLLMDGIAVVTGTTECTDFPTTEFAFQKAHKNGDAFVVALSDDGSDLVYSTYLGGNNNLEHGVAIKAGENSAPVIMGITPSDSFPVTANAYDISYNGQTDIFVAKLGAIAPFLDLPLESASFEEAAQGSNGGSGPGYVNSWFDHTHPGYGQADGDLTTWQGPYKNSVYIDKSNCNTKPGGLGISCYDEHNGIDFRHASEDILAAASGMVTYADWGDFGKQVIIDHNNCYRTLYGHLKLIEEGIDPETTVSGGQNIGIMGNTGLSDGTHLHFGVYHDLNCDGNWSDKVPVDPFPWRGDGADPWQTVPNAGLWIHEVPGPEMVDFSGGTVASPGGIYSAVIPEGAISESVTIELLPSPPVATASAPLRSTGYSFWMRVSEWQLGSSNRPTHYTSSPIVSASANGFTIPVSVMVKFEPSAIPHMDINQLVIQQWEEGSQAWAPLTTTVDTNNNQASAQTNQPGYFDLQGPLICPADTLEPNDNYDGAGILSTDGTSAGNLFDQVQDEDWFQFAASRGVNYAINTANLSDGTDTVIEVFDADGTTMLAADDNSGWGNASSLTWQAPGSGEYYVRVKQGATSAIGCAASYELSIRAEAAATPLQCLAFSPYVLNYNPTTGKHPPASLIDNLLDLILQQTDYKCIMTYGASYPLNHIFPAAKARDLKVIEIIWLEAGEDNTELIEDGIKAALDYPDTIIRVSCGSEVLTRAVQRGLPDPLAASETVISDCINQVKTAGVSQPITSNETWWQWCSKSDKCQVPWGTIENLVDWIGVNVYPWWDSKNSATCIPATQAAEYTMERIQQVKNLYPSREVVLTEFGWPAGPQGYRETNADGQKCDVAGRINQNEVIVETSTALNNAAIQGVLFEAFREPWKGMEGKVGPFWGILVYKHQPVLIDPDNMEQLVNRRPTFDWNDVTKASGYNIQVSKSNTFTTLLVNTTAKTSEYTAGRDLPADSTLYWRVRSRMGTTYGSWSMVRSFKTANPPSVPVLLSPFNGVNIKGYMPVFKWKSSTVPAGTVLDDYRIQLATDLTFSNLVLDERSTAAEFTPAAELLQGMKYYWRVSAYNTEGEYSSWSPKWSFRTSATLFDNGIWWIKKDAPLQDDFMSLYVNNVYWGRSHLLKFGHLKSGSNYPEAAVIYDSGYLRLAPLGLPYGTSFILGPAHWDSNNNYFHSLKISRIEIDTAGASPSGPLKITVTARDYSSSLWPSYHFDITSQITFPDPKAFKTSMSISQNYTAAVDFDLSVFRQTNHEGFKIAQFSSMYINNSSHDSDAAYYIDLYEEERPGWFKDQPCNHLVFEAPLGLSRSNPWLQLLHSDDAGWQGNTPSTIIQLADPELAKQVVPQGYLTCSSDPNDDNIGQWLNDETMPASISSGQSFSRSYTLISQDNPMPASPGLLLPSNGQIVSTLRPFFDWKDRYDAASYTIQISTRPTFITNLISTTVPTSSFTPFMDLPKNRTLYWRVRTNGPNGPSAWSKFQFTTPP